MNPHTPLRLLPVLAAALTYECGHCTSGGQRDVADCSFTIQRWRRERDKITVLCNTWSIHADNLWSHHTSTLWRGRAGLRLVDKNQVTQSACFTGTATPQLRSGRLAPPFQQPCASDRSGFNGSVKLHQECTRTYSWLHMLHSCTQISRAGFSNASLKLWRHFVA